MISKRLLVCAACLIAAPAFADDQDNYEIHAAADLAQGECADPNMDDDERAEMIGNSLEDAVRCMGRDWVYGDLPMVQTSALGQLDIDANVSANRIRVTDRDGNLHVFLTSPGLPGNDTLTGEFTGPFRVENGRYTVQNRNVDYFGAPMPYAVFYNSRAVRDTGYAIHGTTAEHQLGRPASHGCLRVRTKHAAFINAQVRQSNDQSVRIHVYGKVASARPPSVKRKRSPAADDDYYVPRSRVPRRPLPPADDADLPRAL